MAIPADSNGTVPVKAKVLIPEKVSPDGLALLSKTLDIDERKGLMARWIGLMGSKQWPINSIR